MKEMFSIHRHFGHHIGRNALDDDKLVPMTDEKLRVALAEVKKFRDW